MSRQVLMVGAAVIVLGLLGVRQVEERIAKLDVKEVTPPGDNAKALSSQEFYPIFARSKTAQGAINTQPLSDAFYAPPPAPPEPVEVAVVDTSAEEVAPPEPPEPDPINFLEQNEQLFSLQATFARQQAAIINGVSYFQGDYLQGGLPAHHQDRYGEMQKEVLRIKVVNVGASSVTLTADHSEGWQQMLTLDITT